MTSGFSTTPHITIYKDEVDKIIKQYKKVKKYMKSPLFQIKKMDGTEKIVSDLMKEFES